MGFILLVGLILVIVSVVALCKNDEKLEFNPEDSIEESKRKGAASGRKIANWTIISSMGILLIAICMLLDYLKVVFTGWI